MSNEELLNVLERSAKTLLAAPNVVSEEQRHAAEQFFLDFEKSGISLEICRQILETSHNDFVLFRVSSLFRHAILRDWNSLGSDAIDAAHAYLLNYIVNNTNLYSCVREQLVLTLAIIYKRHQIEPDSEKNKQLFDDIAKLTHTGNIYLQLVACSILLALLSEFSSSCRTTSIGLTWEQHSRCKVKFEQSDLKQAFIFCLSTLNDILSKTSVSVDHRTLSVIDRLLAILEQVFMWNFTSRLSRHMMYLTNGQASNFCPPIGWKDVILTENITNLLFQVHAKVRDSPSLCTQSLTCLSQLASLNGPIFADEIGHRDFIKYFVQSFVSFVSRVELKSSECLGVATITKKLLEFTPVWVFLELPEELLSALLLCMTRFTCDFCRKAHLGVENTETLEDDSVYMEALEGSLDAWITIINHAGDFSAGVLRSYAAEIFGTYLQCHLPSLDQQEEASNEFGDEDEEDCEKFCDQLFAIGAFARLVLDYSIPLLNRLFHEKLTLLGERLQNINPNAGCSPDDQRILDNINEHLHWLLLITANVLTSSSDGENAMIQESLIELTLSDNPNISVAALLSTGVNVTSPANTSQTIELIASVFRLAQLENKAFQAGLVAYLSPQVSESLMSLLIPWVAAYLIFEESYYSKMSPVFSFSFGADSESGIWLIDFILDKVLANLVALNSEAGVTAKTLEVLNTLVSKKNRRDVTVKSNAFWNMANSFSANAFPFNVLSPDARKSFCQTLILASSAKVSSEQRHSYIQMVLGSFSTQLTELLKRPDLQTIFHSDVVKTEVQNTFDCLCAVAEAARANSAVVIFEFMYQILVDSVRILDLYHNYEEVVHLVLELFSVVTKQLGCYLSKKDSVHMYEVCLLMMQTYSKHNQGRCVVKKDVEEGQFSDLLSLIHMLTNILSKDFISFADQENGTHIANGTQVDDADVALYGINILVPLMSTELLKIPMLCSAYLSLLSYMAEIHASQLSRLHDEIFAKMSSAIEFAIKTHGTEIVRVCLELIAFLATYAYEQKPMPEDSILCQFGNHFLKILFEMLLLETFDVDLLEVASNAVFTLLCCHQNRYCELVNELLRQHSTSPYYQRLLDAFTGLTPPDFQADPSRQNRVKFYERFDQFVVNVRGFMCVR